MRKEKILVVAREPVREWLEIFLGEEQFGVHSAADGYHGMELIEKLHPNLVITDLTLRDVSGLHVLQTAQDAGADIPVIMMTAGEELWPVIEAMERGAYDCIEKPVEICRLRQIIGRALHIDDFAGGNGADKSKQPSELDIGSVIVGKSHRMLDIHGKIKLLSSARTNILVQGESGTGKRLVSRVIHDSGVTKGHPFVAVDLPALPESLIEKVLFGQVKEANPGRSKDRKGLFELAGAGTIFLNGISGISPDVQEKLLRVLQKREFQPVGSYSSIPVKARLIGATDNNLGELVRKGKFREDLFYRVAHCVIDIPPLRERREDIPRLVVHFLRKINKDLRKNVRRIPGQVIETLQNEEWPGNVRELESVLMHAVAAADGNALQEEHLKSRGDGTPSQPEDRQKLSLDLAEREHIKYVLDETNWDKSEAARLLKISRQTLYNKIKAYGIMPN